VGDVELLPFWAGQSCSLVSDVKSAGDIVRDLVREAEEVIERMQGMVAVPEKARR
jgi:NAD(P)H-dependent flavin oxidoreductase YrpB (nitropropane dioxygenase family)